MGEIEKFSTEDLREEVAKIKQMTYETRKEFYECPFEDNSIPSWIHFISKRDGTLKQFNKAFDKMTEKHKLPLESITSERKFCYSFKFAGIDKVFSYP